MLLIAAAGCGSEKAVEGNGPLPDNTEITALTVTPPSGTGKFELTVAYRFEYRGPGSVPRAETIYCYYYEPDGDYVHIGDIDPNQHPEAWALATREQWVDYEVTLPFDVRSASGTAPLGVYRMECEVGDRAALQEDTRGFTVVAAESGTTESIAAATTTFAPTTTTAPAPVYRLQVEMTVQGTGYEMKAAWGGDITVNPDGSVRTKVPGVITAAVPLEVNGKHAGTYGTKVTFDVDVAGMAELAPAGLTLRLQQTFADYKVQPLTVVEGEIDAASLASSQKAVEEAAPKWLDQILRELVFEGTSLPATQDVSVGSWKGTATISQLQ